MNKLVPIIDALTALDLWRQPGDVVKVYLTVVGKSVEGTFKGGITRLMHLIHHPLAGIEEETGVHAAAVRKARKELLDIVEILEVARVIEVETDRSWRVLELSRLEMDVGRHKRRAQFRRHSRAYCKRKLEKEAAAAAAEIQLMEKAIA